MGGGSGEEATEKGEALSGGSGRGRSVERGGVRPWYVALRSTVPGAGCLGFSNRKSAKGRLTFQSAEESFERRPDRSTPHGPAALSAALRCDIQTAPRPPQMPPFQAAGGRRSNRRFAAAPPAGLGKGSFGQRALRTPPSLRTEGVMVAGGCVERWATGTGHLVSLGKTRLTPFPLRATREVTSGASSNAPCLPLAILR